MSFYSTDHYVGHSLDLYGEYSEGEVGLFRHVVRGGDVVVEVGSNIGALTLPLSLLVGHQGVVHAFEPQTDIFEILKCNVETCKNVTLWNSALASHRASIRYATPRRDKICNPGNCELIIQGDSDPGALGSAQTLDDLFHDLPIALIKIDVEGMELDVLKGGNYILRRYRPLLYMEDDRPEKSRDLRSWLGAQGYRIYRHAPPLYNPRNWRNYQINVFGNTVSINLFCVPQERFDLGHITKRLVRLRQDSSSA
jgi:FkbM family methyltransferase